MPPLLLLSINRQDTATMSAEVWLVSRGQSASSNAHEGEKNSATPALVLTGMYAAYPENVVN